MASERPVRARAKLKTLAEVRAAHIQTVLQHTGGNKTEAARILGVNRRTLARSRSRSRSSG